MNSSFTETIALALKWTLSVTLVTSDQPQGFVNQSKISQLQFRLLKYAMYIMKNHKATEKFQAILALEESNLTLLKFLVLATGQFFH